MSQSGLTAARAPIPSCGADLPSPPGIEVELVRELARASTSFLTLRELELRNRYADETRSATYRYSLTERVMLDAVALVLFRRPPGGRDVEIVLRSQLRPPLAFRAGYEVPLLALGTGAVQWEIPAGLVEPGERGEAGLFARARAEALEEVGVVLPLARFRTLGAPSSLSPGLIAEKLHFVCAEILDGDAWELAAGDGHAVEEHSRSLFVPLPVALRALAAGSVHDVKTEIGIHRLRASVEAGEPARVQP